MNTKTYIGKWWLASNPAAKIPGTLTIEPDDEITLELVGSFVETERHVEVKKTDLILGVTSDTKEFSLLDCRMIHSSTSSVGVNTTSFSVDISIMGGHFSTVDDINFTAIWVCYSHLAEWVNISGFNIDNKFSEKKFVVTYTYPENIEVKIDDNLSLFIDIKPKLPKEFHLQTEATISQSTYIRIMPSYSQPLDYFKKIMRYIEQFLSLGMSEPVHALHIEGQSEAVKLEINGKFYLLPLEIRRKVFGARSTERTLMPSDMLFTYDDIKDRFILLIKNWFNNYHNLSHIYNLYFATIYNPNMYLEQKFLYLIFAVEAFYNQIIGGQYVSVEEYKTFYKNFVECIPNNLSKELRLSIMKLLEYGNELSLRRKLKNIFKRYDGVLRKYILDDHGFIARTVNTRNYEVHHDNRLESRAAKGEDLYKLIFKLNLLLEVCLMAEMGFTEIEIDKLLSRKYRFLLIKK